MPTMDAKHQEEMLLDSQKGLREEKVEEWEAKGLMTTQQIIKRLNMELDERVFHSTTEAIQENFDLLCVERLGVRYLDEVNFVAFLARAFPPSFSPIIEGGPIIYASAVYLTGFPFFNEPPLLTLEGFLRALKLMLPEHANCWISGSGTDERLVSRERTEIDHVRLLFQSLAASNVGSIDDSQSNGQELEMKIMPRPSWYDPCFRASNTDADGDELYHDVLDVLSATQPIPIYKMPVSRDDLRHLATSLWDTKFRLNQYRISREKLACLVRLMLSMQMSDTCQQNSYTTNRLPELRAVTECVVNAFSMNNETGITWPIFYPTMTSVAVRLPRLSFEVITDSVLAFSSRSLIPSPQPLSHKPRPYPQV